MSSASTTTRTWFPAVFVLVVGLILFTFTDTTGYEGDDVNTVVSAMFLPDALDGKVDLYRYDWMPLSYWVSYGAFVLTGDPTAIFLLAPLMGLVSLVLALVLVSGSSADGRTRWGLGLVFLLMLPELWFASLFYNATIIGMPMMLGAIALVWRGPRTRLALSAAGILAAAAILTRFDFAIATPALATLTWIRYRSLRPVAIVAGAAMAIGLVAWGAGLVDPFESLSIYRVSAAEIVERRDEEGWDFAARVKGWSVYFSLVGWVVVPLGLGLLVARRLRGDWRTTLLVGVVSIPLVLPLRDLLCPKYGLAAQAFLLPLGLPLLDALRERLPSVLRRRFVPLLVLATALVGIVSFRIERHPLRTSRGIEVARTHDGPRCLFGYVWFVPKIPTLGYRPLVDEVRALLDERLSADGPDLAVRAEKSVFIPSGGFGKMTLLELARRGASIEVTGQDQYLAKLAGQRITIGPGVSEADGELLESSFSDHDATYRVEPE